jgi:hypothetical protein
MSSGDSWLRLQSGQSRCLLGPGPLRRPWLRWPKRGAGVLLEVEILPPVSPSEAGPDPAEGGNDAEGAAAPSIDV